MSTTDTTDAVVWGSRAGSGSEHATTGEGWRLNVLEQGYAGGWANPVVIGCVTEADGRTYLARCRVAEGAYRSADVRARVELLADMVRRGEQVPNNFTIVWMPDVSA